MIALLQLGLALALPLPLPAPDDSVRGGTAADDSVRVVLFGDSNTDVGWSGTDPRVRIRSYVSDGPPRLGARETNSPLQLAGKIERHWRAVAGAPGIRVVNHAISGTTTGGGSHGGQDRNRGGAPNARTVVNGVTRFEGEVLGAAYPWSGGEPASASYPAGPIRRVNAFAPGPNDFAYVSLGTNDLANDGVAPQRTLDNLTWMVDRWTGAGLAADHLILTTLAPRLDRDLGDAIPAINAGIRALASRRGTGLVDLAAITSADDGRSWREAALHVGDRLHYSEAVRDSLAARTVAYVRARLAPRPAEGARTLDTAALERVLPDEMRKWRPSGQTTCGVRRSLSSPATRPSCDPRRAPSSSVPPSTPPSCSCPAASSSPAGSSAPDAA